MSKKFTPSKTRKFRLGLETLEERALPATNAFEQEFIYLLNRARSNPALYQQENNLPVDLSSVSARQPLALNELLGNSSEYHSNDMANLHYFGHQSPSGLWPNRMAENAGYDLPNWWSPNGSYADNYIESIAAGYANARTSLNALIVDAGVNPPGHRQHLLGMTTFFAEHKEIGVGYVHLNNDPQFFYDYWSIHTALREGGTNDVFLTGVAFNDSNNNSRYDAGEGLGNINIQAGIFSTVTNAAGGWSLRVTPNQTYTVTASGSGFNGTAAALATVGTSNVEVDFASGQQGGYVNFVYYGSATPNNAPVLDNSGSPNLTTIAVGAANPAGNVISSFLGNTITDSDSNPLEGIAVVGLTGTANGAWQYSINNGSTWTNFGTVSASQARLLRDTDLVRFVPNTTYTGGNATLTYAAWDRTAGSVGGTANLTGQGSTGGATSFSTAQDTATVRVNGAPVLPALPNQNMGTSQNLIQVVVNGTDPNGDAISYTGQALNTAQLAYFLDQRFGLSYYGTYSQNTYGQNEKWMLGNGGVYYMILPNGEVRRWTGAISTTLQPENLIGTLDSSYHANPNLLHNATVNNTVLPISVGVSGNAITIDPNSGYAGTFHVGVTASDGTFTTAGSFQVTVVNRVPTILPIANQTRAAGPGVVQVNVVASDLDGDPLTLTASAMSLAQYARQLDQQLGLATFGSYSTNQHGQGEKWMVGTGNVYFAILPNGEVRRWTGTVASLLSPANLVGTLDASYHTNPALLHDSPDPTGPAPASTSFNGTQLTVDPLDNLAGSFFVTVTADDGPADVSTTFRVTLTNNAPVVSPIANQNLAGTQTATTLTLSGSDSDGHTIAYSASIRNPSSQLYNLDQQYGLYFPGSYYQNAYGRGEKWLQGNGGAYYVLTGDGSFYAWTGSVATTFTAGNRIAILGASVFADPSLLFNAAAPVPNTVTANVNGNQLVVNRPLSYVGTFTVDVSGTDGFATATQSFTVTAPNLAPTLAAIGDQTLPAAQGSRTILLNGADGNGQSLTYSARVTGLPGLAYQTRQNLGLAFPGSYYQNTYGQQEKWLIGTGGVYYMLSQAGGLYRWTGAVSTTFVPSNLIAQFDATYYADPSLLWNAQVPGVALALNNNQLTMTPANVGNFAVEVAVSDGLTSTTRTFNVSVINNAPTLAVINTQTLSRAAGSIVVHLGGNDTDGDALTYSATNLLALAYGLDQQYGFQNMTNYSLNAHGRNEKWVLGTGGQYYAILSDGGLYRWTGVVSTTFAASNRLAQLTPAYYADPSLLTNAPVGPTLSILGNQLTISVPGSFTASSFVVDVLVSDGFATATRSFTVNVVA